MGHSLGSKYIPNNYMDPLAGCYIVPSRPRVAILGEGFGEESIFVTLLDPDAVRVMKDLWAQVGRWMDSGA